MTTQKELGDPANGKSTLVRPRFTAGLMLQDDDLTLAVDYVGNLSRLLFKSLFGCGVICGLEVTPSDACGLTVKVDKGLAFDCHGDPVELPGEASIVVQELIAPPTIRQLWVAIKRKEYHCSPRTAVCAPEEEDQSTQVATRLRDGYELRLFEALPDCTCVCDAKKTVQGGHVQNVQQQVGAVTANPGRNVYYTVEDDCYKGHYERKCACDCCCQWVVLGRVFYAPDPRTNNIEKWQVDYAWRRVVRPVLARDLKVPSSA
jgi:hypothetical protein